MASIGILRKDSNGHIISKNQKGYHISFKENIDIINVISFKKYNNLKETEYIEDDEDMEEKKEIEENDEEENETKGNFIDNYKKADVEYYSNKDPNSFSKNGCHIF